MIGGHEDPRGAPVFGGAIRRHGDFKDRPELPVISRAVVHNGIVYTSGIVAEPGGSIEEQTALVLERLEVVLLEVEATRSSLLSVQVWLANMDDFAAHNRIWDAWVDHDNPPARACVGAQLFQPELLIEMRGIAAVVQGGSLGATREWEKASW
jgi:enamine deaminase RidA (YjgF/YER057c/UK114 family)